MLRLLRNLAINLTLLLFSIVVCGLILEIALRIHNPFLTRIRGDRLVIEVNRQIKFRNTTVRGLDPEVTFTRNAIGFRGPNPPARFSESLTLVTIGGSTTLCMWLSDDKTWSALLGRRLARSFRDFWLDNAGLEGHSTFGHLVLLEQNIVPLHPKMALFLVGANDVARDENSAWDAENVKTGIILVSFKTFLKSMSAHSELAALILDGYRTYEAHRVGLGHVILDITKQGRIEHSPEELRAYLEGFLSSRYRELYLDRLRRLIALSRRGGIEPVFVTQPLLVGPAVDDVTGIDLGSIQIAGALNGNFMWGAQEVYNDMTRRVCADSGVVLVDLARQMPKSSRYYYDMMHFTNAGAERVAEIVARDLCPQVARRYPEFVVRDCAACADTIAR